MATPVNPPRGMRDFLPAAKNQREKALNIIREVYRGHGFDEIETPVLEDYARLHSGLGGDNEKLSFSVLRRGLNSDDLAAATAAADAASLCDLGLRFDLTVPLARFYASHRAELPQVFRAIQIAPVWRAERPQKGRFRQFVQADIDIIGEPGLLAEVELIAATSAAFARLGLSELVIRVNDRRILSELLNCAGFAAATHARALIALDKLDKIGVSGVIAELRELDVSAANWLGEMLAQLPAAAAGEAALIGLDAASIVKLLPPAVSGEGVANLVALGAALRGALPAGVQLAFDPTLVRGMGYYTGTIFEVSHPSSGSSIGGGGRYDGMVGRFLGQQVPAVGFSIGFERVVDLLTLDDIDSGGHTALVYDPAAAPADLLRIKQQLILAGQRVRLVRRTKNLKALLAQLRDSGFSSFAQLSAAVADASELEFRELS